jgi:hypothetical protein
MGKYELFKIGDIDSALFRVLANPTTVAPFEDRTRAVSKPSPEFTPVIRTVFPISSSPSVTSSAVLEKPSPLGPFLLNILTRDITYL